MEKIGSSDLSVSKSKKQRKSITLEDNLDVIRKYEYNECTVNIVRMTGILESILRTIRNQERNFKIDI